MRWQKTMGKDVIDTTTAKSVGKVDGLVLDPESSRIVAVLVANQVIDWSETGGIGRDAVTLSGVDQLREPREGLERRTFDGDASPIKKRVLTEDGFELGSVGDIDFDSSTGELRQLILSDDEVAGSRLIGVGTYAVMVSSPQRASQSQGGLDNLSRAELYEMAKERDLPGRASMSSKELRQALS